MHNPTELNKDDVQILFMVGVAFMKSSNFFNSFISSYCVKIRGQIACKSTGLSLLGEEILFVGLDML